MNGRVRKLRPFVALRQTVNGAPITSARFACARCGGHADLQISSHEPPEKIVKRAERVGWHISNSRAECPICVNRDRSREKPKTDWLAKAREGLKERFPEMAVSPIPTARAPSADQRQRIRALLDANFDDAKGRYLDGFSDQKIAEDLSVPRVFVEQIREAAYGPIRVSPDAEKLERDIKAALEKMAGLEKELSVVRQSVSGFDARLKAFL